MPVTLDAYVITGERAGLAFWVALLAIVGPSWWLTRRSDLREARLGHSTRSIRQVLLACLLALSVWSIVASIVMLLW